MKGNIYCHILTTNCIINQKCQYCVIKPYLLQMVTQFAYFRSGEAPLAYVVRNMNSNISSKDVIEFVATRAAAYKHLVGGVEFIEQIPRSAAGKILRKNLREKFNKSGET